VLDSVQENTKALGGIKVANFTHAIAGPLAASILASYGATVVKFESRNHLDWMRQTSPFIGNIQTPDRATAYLTGNSGGQYGATLNFRHPSAYKVIAKIVTWADVVIENFAGGVLAKAGLGYEDLKKIKPEIIMLSGPIFGQTGPFANMPGFGSTLTALSGIAHLTGFPDEPPQLPSIGFTDFISPRVMVLAIVAALDYRYHTGKGQFIDAAQVEAVLPFLTRAFLDYEVNGREAEREGNRSDYLAPHAVYPCKGEDRWCTISVTDDLEWEKFIQVIGCPAWTQSSKFSSPLARVKNAGELDKLVGGWTMNYPPEEIMSLLQSAGIASGVVHFGQDLAVDPHLEANNYYWETEIPGIGKYPYSGMPVKMSETPYVIKRAPLLGEHNEYVYTNVLGFPDEEFVNLLADGVLD
jgi:benzylsuccinate CoA-transferase BbsF subunit